LFFANVAFKHSFSRVASDMDLAFKTSAKHTYMSELRPTIRTSLIR